VQITRLSTKGQIVMPRNIRESHSWPAGTEFEWKEVEGGVLLKPRRPFPGTTVDQVCGILKTPRGKRASLADMERAIESEVKQRHERGRF
jgi:bifunctional DNA-binding transcriptional regulator/antitoxin component of YhaV-PrlF toxin-antitoxin module